MSTVLFCLTSLAELLRRRGFWVICLASPVGLVFSVCPVAAVRAALWTRPFGIFMPVTVRTCRD